MDRELEIAGLGSVGGWIRLRKKHAPPPGGDCVNCGTVLLGSWCYECGQPAEDYHRSIGHLIGEGLEGLFHVDGRLLNTIPRLVVDPGGLTRDFLDGKRIVQIPPLRLFLVVLLIFFFAGSLNRGGSIADFRDQKAATAVKAEIDPTPRARVGDINISTGKHPGEKSAMDRWLEDHVKYAQAHQERFESVLEEWSHRFAFMLLPLSALILSLLYVFQRRFFIFDHLIFSMHSLSFLGLLISTQILLGHVIGGWAGLLVFAAPVHLFRHMRGVYGSSVFGTLLRMFILFLLSMVSVGLIFAGLILVGLAHMHG